MSGRGFVMTEESQLKESSDLQQREYFILSYGTKVPFCAVFQEQLHA